MDVKILTSDPEAVDAINIRDTLEAEGYFVKSVTVVDRESGATTSES